MCECTNNVPPYLVAYALQQALLADKTVHFEINDFKVTDSVQMPDFASIILKKGTLGRSVHISQTAAIHVTPSDRDLVRKWLDYGEYVRIVATEEGFSLC